jgi:hypothetical protein
MNWQDIGRQREARMYADASKREELKDVVESDLLKHSVPMLNAIPDYLVDLDKQCCGDEHARLDRITEDGALQEDSG